MPRSRVDLEMKSTKLWAFLMFLAVSGATYSASADPTKTDDNYGYVFRDPDVLSADASVVTAAPIRVQKRLHREVHGAAVEWLGGGRRTYPRSIRLRHPRARGRATHPPSTNAARDEHGSV